MRIFDDAPKWKKHTHRDAHLLAGWSRCILWGGRLVKCVRCGGGWCAGCIPGCCCGGICPCMVACSLFVALQYFLVWLALALSGDGFKPICSNVRHYQPRSIVHNRYSGAEWLHVTDCVWHTRAPDYDGTLDRAFFACHTGVLSLVSGRKQGNG